RRRCDDSRVGSIHHQHLAAEVTSHFKSGSVLRHERNNTANRRVQRGSSLIGRILNKNSISQPRSNTETTTTRTASNSPKLRRLRSGSNRLPTRLRILMVAKPKTSAQRMLYTSPFLFSNCHSANSSQCGWKGRLAHEASEVTRVVGTVEAKTMANELRRLKQLPGQRKRDITLFAARSQRTEP